MALNTIRRNKWKKKYFDFKSITEIDSHIILHNGRRFMLNITSIENANIHLPLMNSFLQFALCEKLLAEERQRDGESDTERATQREREKEKTKNALAKDVAFL